MKNQLCLVVAIALHLFSRGQIPAPGNVLWLRADRNVFNDNMITRAKLGDLVQVWQDQSGNGNHFSQLSNGKRPQLVAYANTLCSQPLVHFDVGRATYLSSAFKMIGAKTIFIVFLQPAVVNTPETLLSIKASTGTFTEVTCTNATGYQSLSFLSEITPSPSGGILTRSVGINMTFSSNGNIFMMTYNGGTNSSPASYSAHNNVTAATVNSSGMFGRLPQDTTTIGGRASQQNYSFLSGDIGEIIVYNRVLTAAEIIQVENYLAPKFGFQGSCKVLEAAAIQFNARLNNTSVVLDWNAYDADVDHYVIEKSTDDIHWDSLGVIKINSSSANKYSFTDDAPYNDINYYRVKIFTNGGLVLYSSCEKIKIPHAFNSGYSLLSNPVTHSLYIRSQTKEMVVVHIFSAQGQLVATTQIYTNTPVDASYMRPGTYLIKINGKGNSATLKFFKQ